MEGTKSLVTQDVNCLIWGFADAAQTWQTPDVLDHASGDDNIDYVTDDSKAIIS